MKNPKEASYLINTVEEGLERLTTQVIILHDRNPLDMDTPVAVPLHVVAWGYNAEHVTYSVPGYNEISTTEEDEFYIVTNGISRHIVRKSQPHIRFYAHDQVCRMIEEEAGEVADELYEMFYA